MLARCPRRSPQSVTPGIVDAVVPLDVGTCRHDSRLGNVMRTGVTSFARAGSAVLGPLTDRSLGCAHDDEAPTRNLAMELVRTTEAAALAASNWVGRGDKEGADGAAVDAMRLILGTVSMTGTVIIGEGEKDEAPMLYNGEVVGDGSPTARRHRGRPDRRHDAHVEGSRRRGRRDRRVRDRARCSTRARACTWRRSRSGPRART